MAATSDDSKEDKEKKAPIWIPDFATWVNVEHWRERIITFDPSWFLVCMGTGIIVQLLTNFPYPAQWLRNLAYCFWVLDMLLFVFFSIMASLRLILYPKVAVGIFSDFSQTSFFGAVPIALDTIIVGITLFYGSHPSAVWAAFGLYWANVFLTAAVVFGGVFAMYHHQGEHELKDVTGVWLLSFIPMIVISATGSGIAPHLPRRAGVAILFVSFMMWALGLGMSYIILGIYFWRLMKEQLPPRQVIISCFVPVGPLGMGAYAIQNLAIGLATHINKYKLTLQRPPQPPVNVDTISAISEGVHWLGILLSIALLGLATFFLVEAAASVVARMPRSFNIGFWAFVFPCGVYSNASCSLSTDLRDGGLKVFAAICVVSTILLWLGCTLGTVYKGLWKGKLFYAPGLQGWAEQQHIDERRKSILPNGGTGHALGGGQQEYEGSNMVITSSGSDGTYAYSRRPANSSAHQA